MILLCCASELGLPEDLSAIEVILYYYYYYHNGHATFGDETVEPKIVGRTLRRPTRDCKKTIEQETYWLNLRLLCENALEYNRLIFCCFIDAFVRCAICFVSMEAAINIARCLENLYNEQSAEIGTPV